MKPKQLGDDDVSLGLVVVDWDKREVNWEGMDGCGEPMTAQQLLDRMEELDEAAEKGSKNYYTGLLFWHEENQLTCHDTAGVVNELFEDEEDEEEGEDHEHQWGPLERSRLAGTVHRKCQVPGCKAINAYDEEDEDEDD